MILPRAIGCARAALWPWVTRGLGWHVAAFLTLNGILTAANIAAGSPWWAFWPLAVSGFLLGLHYLVYKSATVDAQWAAERVAELNLKSYDRSHIEELKTRFGADVSELNRPQKSSP